MRRWTTPWKQLDRRGQALTEFALVAPIALLVLFAIIILGLFVFYQQQVTNVAREAARHAAIHSSTALCPTASWREPQAPPDSYPEYPFHCDGPNNPNDAYPWPKMTDHARGYAWGLNKPAVMVNACWSGYLPAAVTPGGSTNADFPPVQVDPITSVETENVFHQCTIDGLDPIAAADSMGCRARMTTATDDLASDAPGNQVTVYACYAWTPPMAGVLFIPSTITIRAVITEVLHRQQ